MRGREKRRRFGRGLASIGDAVWNPDGSEATAGDEHAGNGRQVPVDRGHALQVADLVLRALLRPPEQTPEQRGPGDSEQLRQLFDDQIDELGIVSLESSKS